MMVTVKELFYSENKGVYSLKKLFKSISTIRWLQVIIIIYFLVLVSLHIFRFSFCFQYIFIIINRLGRVRLTKWALFIRNDLDSVVQVTVQIFAGNVKKSTVLFRSYDYWIVIGY